MAFRRFPNLRNFLAAAILSDTHTIPMDQLSSVFCLFVCFFLNATCPYVSNGRTHDTLNCRPRAKYALLTPNDIAGSKKKKPKAASCNFPSDQYLDVRTAAALTNCFITERHQGSARRSFFFVIERKILITHKKVNKRAHWLVKTHHIFISI